MPTLSLVHPYPAQGYADRQVGDEVEDCGIRAFRSVAELYGEALADLGIDHRISELRIFTHHDAASDQVTAIAHVDVQREGPETGFVHLPSAFLSLTPSRRAETLLEALHGIVVRLAEARGWDAPLGRCRDHALAAGLEFRWDGPWKSSPDRRHQARLRFRLPPDGYGRARVEVARRDDGATVATSEESVAFCTSRGFRRAASSLRWRGGDQVSAVPYDFGPAIRGGLVGLRRGDDGGWVSEVDHYTRVRQPPPGDPDAPALRVAVRGSGVSAPEEPHRLVFIGGGPMSGAVHLFDRLFTEAMRRVCGPSGQAWWQDAGISGSIETLYDEDGTRPAVRGRLVGQELRVHVVRPLETLGRGVDVAGLAEADAAAIVALLRRRTRLGPHPELPGA